MVVGTNVDGTFPGGAHGPRLAGEGNAGHTIVSGGAGAVLFFGGVAQAVTVGVYGKWVRKYADVDEETAVWPNSAIFW